MTKKNARANIKILRLQNELNSIRDEMSKIFEEKLDDMLQKSGIPMNQIELVNEIFSAAKYKNPKSRKYSENWILSCLFMFQIR